MPPNVSDYADDLTELAIEDVPWERVPRIKEVMRSCSDKYDALRAAIVLTCWGDEDGFNYLESCVCDSPPWTEILFPHRLRNYDDTYAQVLMTFRRYWAQRATAGFGDDAREKLFKPVSQIIRMANKMPFEIVALFWLVEDAGFTEYLPALKEHLTAILKHPELHHWKIADCAHLLMKFDPEFVEQALAAHGKTLADFPNK